MKGKATERLAKTRANEGELTIRIFHTRSAQKRFPPSALVPPALLFPFWACRLPLGPSYITFILRFVPHPHFFFPPASPLPFYNHSHWLSSRLFTLPPPNACFCKGLSPPPVTSATLRPTLSDSNQASGRPAQRLHPSPSLPNLWLVFTLFPCS